MSLPAVVIVLGVIIALTVSPIVGLCCIAAGVVLALN
jgi:hypothetical protein